MLMLKALRHRPIRRLWFGQALSSIGDEIYRVALVWIAVGLIGADASYLTSAQNAALILVSVIGGKWAEHWDPLRTMVRVDIARAIIVLIPVFYSFCAPVPLLVLGAVAVVLSGLGAFFDPALQTILPKFSPNRDVLKATNGLMMTTIRLARMVGPTLIGFLAGLIAPIQFFTLNAASFLFSFASLAPLAGQEPPRHLSVAKNRIGFREAVWGGFHAIRGKSGMTFIMVAKALTTGTWNLAYLIGFALLVQEIAGNDTRAFGSTMAAYGFGNFLGALYFGNLQRKRPALMMMVGYVWMGVGFVVSAYCQNIPWLMVVVAISGFSGTMNEVTFSDLVQMHFSNADITRVIRLRMALDTTVTLLLTLSAPFFIHLVGVRFVILACALAWIMIGLAGCKFFAHEGKSSA